MVNGVTKSSGQGSTGVLAPIREWPPGGWREKGEEAEIGPAAKRAPLTGSRDERGGRQIREKSETAKKAVVDRP